MTRAAPLALTAALLGLLWHPTPAGADDETEVVLRDYIVKKGDSCLGIAIRELGERTAYKLIHKHNNLGPLPHNLVPGSVLRLPSRGPAKPDASLSSRRGEVNVRRSGAKDAWARAALGMDLFRRWRVNSQRRSTAEITFLDTSRLSMRENTIVIIYGPTAARARRRTSRATLERGELRTRLAELDGKKPPMVVETPTSDAELEGGSALLSVDTAKTSRISNHTGKPARLRSRARRRRAVKVAVGFGSKVETDKSPTPPKPLPPTPVWNAGPNHFVGWAHTGATLRGSWAPVSQAAEYRVEISRDAEGRDVLASVTVPTAITAFEAHGFPAGTYHVSVAARDADKFESAPSATRPLVSVAVALTELGAEAPRPALALAGDEPVATEAGPPTSVVVGATIAGQSVGGKAVQCAPNLLSEGGPTTIQCALDGVVASDVAPLTVDVVGLSTRVTTAAGETVRLIARNEVTAFHIALASSAGAVPASSVRVELSAGLVLVGDDSVEGDRVLKVRATANAPVTGEIRLRLGVGGPIVGVHRVRIEEPAVRSPRPAPPRKPGPTRWEIGALIGHTLVDDEYGLGNARTPAGVLDAGVITGARLAHHITTRITVELEGTYSEPGFADLRDHANIVGYRAHLIGHLADGRVRPFVIGGVGGAYIRTDAPTVSTEADKELYWGVGGRVGFGERASVRLDVRHRLSAGRVARFSNLFEGTLGIAYRL